MSVKNLVDDEDSDNDVNEDVNNSITLDDIRKQMFETENVVIDKNTDHGLSRLTENQGPDPSQNQDHKGDTLEDSFYSAN